MKGLTLNYCVDRKGMFMQVRNRQSQLYLWMENASDWNKIEYEIWIGVFQKLFKEMLTHKGKIILFCTSWFSVENKYNILNLNIFSWKLTEWGYSLGHFYIVEILFLICTDEFSYLIQFSLVFNMGFPGSSDSKGFTCDAGDPGSIPGLRIYYLINNLMWSCK